MYNPFMMNPYGGGMNNYWSPQRMQNAQPMGMYSQDAMQGAQKRDQMQGRVDNLQGRIGTLQEQYKGAGSDQQAGIQNRINTLQGRMGDIQGKMDAGGGANRMGMEYRRERRQAKNAGTYDPQAQGGQPEPAMMQGGFNPWGGMGGMGMGGMGFGGYGGFNPMGMMQNWMQPQQFRTQGAGQNQTGAAPQAGPTPVAPYNPAAQPQAQGGGWNPLTTPTSMGNMFETPWGRLVASSTGNQNVMQLENDPTKLFHFDPRAVGNDGPGARGGWKSMTPEAYASYGDYNYYDPRQAGAAANPMMQQWTRGPGGMIQGKVGTGSYA